MAYSYEEQKRHIFTEDGQVMFLRIRDNAKRLIASAGAVSSSKLMSNVSGDSWTMLACMDRLIELGELIEVPNPQSSWGQHRIFIEPQRTA